VKNALFITIALIGNKIFRLPNRFLEESLDWVLGIEMEVIFNG
jgi:hypothetical protein